MKINENEMTQTLLRAPTRGHVVDFYDDSAQLAKRVAQFAEPALRQTEAVALIAVPQHLDLFRNALQALHLPVAELEKSGRLKCLSAEAALREFNIEGQVY